MPVKAVLKNKDGHTLHNERVQEFKELSLTNDVTLVTMTPLLTHGVFKAVSILGEGTATLALPNAGGSLFITDIVVSAKKVVGTTLDVQFDDGVNTEVLISPDTVNQSTNFVWSPVGRIQGWTDAAITVVTTGANTIATVTVGYVRNPASLSFVDWQGLQ